MRVPEELQTQGELVRLVGEARGGSERAKEELAYRMRPLVVNVVRRYQKAEGANGRYYSREDEDDIEMAGWEGLWEAVQRYDPNHEMGKPFWTVANYRINHHVREWVARNSGSIGMPRKAWRQAADIDDVLEQEDMEDWENYTEEELAEVTGINHAHQILMARRLSWQVDPEKDADADFSAEEEYMALDMQKDMTNTLDAMALMIQRDQDDVAETLAWDYVDRHDIDMNDVALVDLMMRNARRQVGL